MRHRFRRVRPRRDSVPGPERQRAERAMHVSCMHCVSACTVRAHAMHRPELKRIERAVLGRVELVEDRAQLARVRVRAWARAGVGGGWGRGSMGLGFVWTIHLVAAEVAHLAHLAAGDGLARVGTGLRVTCGW